MLQREALVAALPLTEILDGRGLYIEPVAGTPLELLVRATRTGEQFNIPISSSDGKPVEFNPDLENIAYMANKVNDATGISEHNMAVDELVPFAADAVRQHLAFARTVVAPLVDDLAKSTEDAYAALTPSSLLNMEVIVHQVPAPLLSNGLATSVGRFKNMPYDAPALQLNMPDQTYSDLLELIKTGSNQLDTAVGEWLAIKGEVFLLNLWEGVFQIKPGVGAGRSFRDYIEDRVCGEENAIAIYLLANHLFEAGPLEGTIMPLRQFEQVIVEYRNQAGLRVQRALDEIDEIEKNGVLVRDYTPNTITVNSNVYRKWLDEDPANSNNLLFGNLMEQPPHTLASNITANAPRLLAAWNRQAAIVSAMEGTKRIARMKTFLLQNFARQLQDALKETPEGLDVGGITDKFRDMLEMVGESELKCMHELCLRLVCRSRFSNTRAEFILTALNEAKEANPNLSVREAGAVATIRYIAHWLGQQVRVIA